MRRGVFLEAFAAETCDENHADAVAAAQCLADPRLQPGEATADRSPTRTRGAGADGWNVCFCTRGTHAGSNVRAFRDHETRTAENEPGTGAAAFAAERTGAHVIEPTTAYAHRDPRACSATESDVARDHAR